MLFLPQFWLLSNDLLMNLVPAVIGMKGDSGMETGQMRFPGAQLHSVTVCLQFPSSIFIHSLFQYHFLICRVRYATIISLGSQLWVPIMYKSSKIKWTSQYYWESTKVIYVNNLSRFRRLWVFLMNHNSKQDHITTQESQS